VGVGMIDALAGEQISIGVSGKRRQGLQVVADDFGGDILDHSLLSQSGDVFQIESVLEPFERLLDAPSLVVKLAEAVSWIEFLVEQVGHQHALLAVGRDVADQAHALWFAWAFVVERVLLVRCAQQDDPFDLVRAHEIAHAGEAVGIVDAHAELDGAVIEHSDQPAARI